MREDEICYELRKILFVIRTVLFVYEPFFSVGVELRLIVKITPDAHSKK